jgi:transcription antitermination factor NusG
MALTDENISIPFVVGETVKVIDGPFNSFNAEIEGIDEQKKKIKVNGKNIWENNSFGIEFYAGRKNIIKWQKKSQHL